MMNKKMNKVLATTLAVGMLMNNGKKVDIFQQKLEVLIQLLDLLSWEELYW